MHAFIPCSTESMNPYRATDSSIGFVNSHGELTAAVQRLGAASGGLDVLAPDRYRQRLSCARRTRESRHAFPAAFHAERVQSSRAETAQDQHSESWLKYPYVSSLRG